MMALGILHPGEMGSFIAASALRTLGKVYWCSEGRSAATRQRAEQHGLSELPTLAAFCESCDIIISVCPPHAAREQAHAVSAAGFRGCYVDANAIAPQTVRELGQTLGAAGITVVDAGIIGLPAWQAGTTWLYLAGLEAASVARCFAKGPLETAVLGATLGQASALKMCFGAWNKGSTAMLTAILATAEANGVREALERQWDLSTPGFAAQTRKRISGVARKAWRFSAEMEEIAATFAASGVPPEFFIGAAALYARQSGFKDIADAPSVDTILAAVQSPQA